MKKMSFKGWLPAAVAAAGILIASPVLSFANTDNTAIRTGGYVYARVNLSYADFFYGEINDISEENPVINLNAPDAAEPLRGKGQYDAVSSATMSKVDRWSQVYADKSSGSTVAFGIKDVWIRVPETLFDNAKDAIEAGSSCSNPLLDIVRQIDLEMATPSNASDAPSEFKTLNGDGTLTKMETDSEEGAVSAEPEILTGQAWGNYVINLNLVNSPAAADIMGAVIETSDGMRYGMKPMDNLWFRSNNMAFSVREFKEPHGNIPGYERFAGMEGKTITKITYLLKDKKDIVVNTGLLVKTLLPEASKVESDNPVHTKPDTAVSLIFDVPSDASFTIKSLSYKGNALVSGTDYTYDAAESKIKIIDSANTGIGRYTAVFEDVKYEDLKLSFNLMSGISEGGIRLEGNRLLLPGGADTALFISNISSVTVSPLDTSGNPAAGAEKTFTGNNLGGIIFNNDGSIKLDAMVPGRRGAAATAAFPENGKYKLEVKSDGYPAVTGIVNKSDQNNITVPKGGGSSGGGSSVRNSGSVKKTSDSPFKEWVKDAKGWWARLENGSWPASAWKRFAWNGAEYWYYFGADGYMMTGWQWINGKCYYLEPVAGNNLGHMYQNTVTPDGYNVNENGEWVVNGAVQIK